MARGSDRDRARGEAIWADEGLGAPEVWIWRGWRRSSSAGTRPRRFASFATPCGQIRSSAVANAVADALAGRWGSGGSRFPGRIELIIEEHAESAG